MRGDGRSGSERRRWGAVRWWFSLILLVPVLGLAGTIAFQRIAATDQFAGVVLDAYTGRPVADAEVTGGQEPIRTDDDGTFRLPAGTTEVRVAKAGYAAVSMPVPSNGEKRLEIRLRPNVVSGVVRSSATQQPISGATVELRSRDQVIQSSATDASGAFRLGDVPEGASVVIDSPDYARVTIDLRQQTRLEVALRPDVVTGRVTDDQGQPVAGAAVAIGGAATTTGEDGTYRLENAPETGSVVVKAPGYRAAVRPLDSSLKVDASLQPFQAKALYIPAETASDTAALDALLALVDRTELTAVVVDLKDSSGSVFYDTRVPLAHEIGAVRAVLNVPALLDNLHQRGIYAIARIVVFEDPVLAEKRPEWAIHSKSDGGLWRTWNGLAWVNAHRPEVWDYNAALAREAADLGFDEIQLDYIRFPSDGQLSDAEYGVPHNDETRPAAIRDFLTTVRQALAGTPAYLGVDVFGLTLWETGDGGIGQHLETIAPVVDFICPMVYPSHFYSGSLGFDVPNDHPYEVVLWSLENGAERIPDQARKLRPWLQDFSLGEGISYGDAEVRAQIRASGDFGAEGWMLWNAASDYHEGALRAAP